MSTDPWTDDVSDGARLDAALRGGHIDPTHGLQSLHDCLDDVEVTGECCDHCGINATTLPDSIASEEWRRAMASFFADGRPEIRGNVARRVYDYARRVHPAACVRVPREFWLVVDQWLPYQSGAAWNDPPTTTSGRCEWCGVDAGQVEGVIRQRVRRGFVEYLFDGNATDVESSLVRVYAIAKAIYPELLREDGRDMSLERLGDVFDEPNRPAARARWSGRVRRVYNRPVEEAGGVAHAHFQKSATTCAKYAAAQRGNHNRSGKKSPPC
jgi:hypothetical protein